MGIKFGGSTAVSDVRFGSTNVDKVMYGNSVVWERTNGLFSIVYGNTLYTTKDFVNKIEFNLDSNTMSAVYHDGYVYYIYYVKIGTQYIFLHIKKINVKTSAKEGSWSYEIAANNNNSISLGYCFFLGNKLHFSVLYDSNSSDYALYLNFNTTTDTYGFDLGKTGPVEVYSDFLDMAASDGVCSILTSSSNDSLYYIDNDGEILRQSYISMSRNAVSAVKGKLFGMGFDGSSSKSETFGTSLKAIISAWGDMTGVSFASNDLFCGFKNKVLCKKKFSSDGVYTSVDGKSWTQLSATSNSEINRIYASSGKIIAAKPDTGSYIVVSRDGYTFTNVTFLLKDTVTSITYGE